MLRQIGRWVKSICLVLFLFFLGFIKQLFTDAEVCIPDLHRKVSGKVIHEPIAQLRVSIAKHDQFIAGNNEQAGILLHSAGRGRTQAFIYQGDPEQAAAVLHQSIDLVERTRSAAGLRRVFKAGWQLRPWRHEPFVQDVQDRLLALGCAVPPQ